MVNADDGLGGAFSAVTLPASASSLAPTQYAFTITSPTAMTLVIGREYRVSIIASNIVGSVESNRIASVVANLPSAPGAGPAIVIPETGTEQIRVSFATFDNADVAQTGGSNILSYQLQRTGSL